MNERKSLTFLDETKLTPEDRRKHLLPLLNTIPQESAQHLLTEMVKNGQLDFIPESYRHLVNSSSRS